MSSTASSSVTTDTSTPFDLREAVRRHVRHSLGNTPDELTPHSTFLALSLAVRERAVDAALETEARYIQTRAKRAHYLSMEFLMGRALRNNLVNLSLFDEARAVVSELDQDLDAVLDTEPDAALGNGGLGRLAACFLDSLATLGMPGFGYGINYEYGLFKQVIRGGQQIESPDNWRTHDTPWEIARSEEVLPIPLYGRVEHTRDRTGEYSPMWLDWQVVFGIPHDMPIVGYGGKTVNYLRLYSARASQELDMAIFNQGDYINAVQKKVMSETISKVLYPSDIDAAGQELRLVQEYFLVACALRDITNRLEPDEIDRLPEFGAIQLNDTHPALAVAELQRILVDERDVPWDKAWDITRATLGYTNHTLLPEALERWPVGLVEYVLPRHMQIIYEINQRFLEDVGNAFPGDAERKRRMSIIEEGNPKMVRMAHLAIVGSHKVNGVAAVHSELIKTRLVPDFYDLWPKRFTNKTNGVTQRRWLLSCNRELASALREAIGDGWITDLDKLHDLEPFAEDAGFRERFLDIKRRNKEKLSKVIYRETAIETDASYLFDVQIKRLHEYKRQLLNLLHVVHHYLVICDGSDDEMQPRVYVFAGKAAPGYHIAKMIIHLIHEVAAVVNNDPRCEGKLKLAFVPDYKVTLAEVIIPAADLSEQVSTAGFEASGTGNMKFAMNGALTIGTLDGANIEIRDEVGDENIFIFGQDVPGIAKLRQEGVHPRTFYDRSENIRRIMDSFLGDRFSPGAPSRHDWVFHKLVDNWDNYFHLADLDSYLETHAEVDRLYADPHQWARKAILNIARMGFFSSDRTIKNYADEIWKIEPVL